MDRECFRWNGGSCFYVPSSILKPGDRVRLRNPETHKPEYPAVVKLRERSRVLLSVSHGRGTVLEVVPWSACVLECDLPAEPSPYDLIGGAA